MDPWSLPKARPISCNDSPAFQRRHMSVLCSAESLSRLPCAINTTFRKMIHIRWCCTDRLRPPGRGDGVDESEESAGAGARLGYGELDCELRRSFSGDHCVDACAGTIADGRHLRRQCLRQPQFEDRWQDGSDRTGMGTCRGGGCDAEVHWPEGVSATAVSERTAVDFSF